MTVDVTGNIPAAETLLGKIEQELVKVYRGNPNLVVFVRADKDGRIEPFAEIMNRCIKNGITKFSFRTAPEK